MLPDGPFPDRRLGRVLAFQTLYEVDLAQHTPAQVLQRLATPAALPGQATPYPPEVLAAAARYGQELVQGVLAHRREIDALIRERAPAWPLAQMAAVDRNVLRIAIREFLVDNLTPVGAAINEAVELAKKYGSENSGRFINGVLGSVSAPGKAVPQEGN